MAKAPTTLVIAMMAVSDTDLAAAFTEWERRYRECPEQFETRRKVARGTPESYGDSCAYWLLQIITEQIAAAKKARSEPSIVRQVKRRLKAG
jgi:hypothetical protein